MVRAFSKGHPALMRYATLDGLIPIFEAHPLIVSRTPLISYRMLSRRLLRCSWRVAHLTFPGS